ncbi:hypothetical protein F4777DRAFT_110002 [Nemania sp. FL0916]|nr:hypothetical protein F4777DRAFT_110002 [Nemania sp. FL0916]
MDLGDVIYGASNEMKERLFYFSRIGLFGQMDMLGIHDLIAFSRGFDESLSSFDWFHMHDICQSFFDALRALYMDNYIKFKSNHYADLDVEYKHDEPDSFRPLDALYFLAFAEPSKKRTDNLILAALTHNPMQMGRFDIPELNYLTERWNHGIDRYANVLGFNLLSAARVLQSVIKQEGSLTVLTKAAEKQRKYHRSRGPVPKDSTEAYEKAARSKWWHPVYFESHPNSASGVDGVGGSDIFFDDWDARYNETPATDCDPDHRELDLKSGLDQNDDSSTEAKDWEKYETGTDMSSKKGGDVNETQGPDGEDEDDSSDWEDSAESWFPLDSKEVYRMIG